GERKRQTRRGAGYPPKSLPHRAFPLSPSYRFGSTPPDATVARLGGEQDWFLIFAGVSRGVRGLAASHRLPPIGSPRWVPRCRRFRRGERRRVGGTLSAPLPARWSSPGHIPSAEPAHTNWRRSRRWVLSRFVLEFV